MEEIENEIQIEEEDVLGIKIVVPSILSRISDASLPILALDKSLVAEFEDFCHKWEEEATQIVDNLPKKPETFTPLAELELWRGRSVTLAALYDQLESKDVRRVLVVLEEAKSVRVSSLEFTKKEVYWKLQEARDITRFLATIERHLKTLTYSINFNDMIAALPHIMEGLQMIWMLSRHYNKEERMGMMLQMIGKLLDERVTNLIHPKVLFQRDPLVALDLSDQAKNLFVTWISTYMNTRHNIEQSGKGTRWEFDRTRLFSRTEYDALIAQHLSEISVVLLEFTNFFGPEIKEVIGDSRKVDDALKNAYMLVKPFVEVEFDPFLAANGKLWTNLLEQLRKDVRILESEATSFIDEAFTTVKSAEAAFEMLMKFKHIETRDGIHAKLMKKFEDTLMIYIQEVRSVKEFYEQNLDNPTLLKYNPPIAGRVWWVRSIFYHLKRSILTFRSQSDVISTSVGQLACQEYLQLAQAMKRYEDTWYKLFCDMTHVAIPAIRQNVFVKVPTGKELSPDLDISKNKDVFRVNLPVDMMEMVQEALNFEQMGYRISETVRNIAFQRNQYIRSARILAGIVGYYYQVRRNLRPAETLLMEKSIREMEKHFEQGLNRLNWTGLAIPEYAGKLTLTVQKFDDVVTQVNKVAKDIRVRLWIMRNSKFYLEPPYKEGKYSIAILDCWAFFKYWERYRHRVIDKLLSQFGGLPPLFLKLETLIYGTATGKLKQFRPYFSGWEKRIFLFMSKFIIRTLYDFEKRLSFQEPLFEVSAILVAPEIHLSPTPHEIYNMVLTGAQECVFGAKNFVRWLRGTCTPAPPVMQGEDPFIYSYYLDIGRLPRVLQLLIRIQETIQNLLGRVWEHLKRYRKFKNLWRFNKEKTVMAFAQSNPSVQHYDQKMGFYFELAVRVEELPSHRLEGGLRVNMEPLHAAIRRLCDEWVGKIGGALYGSTRDLSTEFDRIVKEYEQNVFIIPRSVEELKKVLTTIKAIQDSTVDMEGRYHDLKMRYATLTRYRIEFEEEEIHLLDETWKQWNLLWLHEIKIISKQLDPVKARFKKLAIQQRAKLKADLVYFCKRFYASGGPSPIQWNIDNGFEVLKRLHTEFKQLEKTKGDVTTAEKLLGLEITFYPELGEMSSDIKSMEVLLEEEALRMELTNQGRRKSSKRSSLGGKPSGDREPAKIHNATLAEAESLLGRKHRKKKAKESPLDGVKSKAR